MANLHVMESEVSVLSFGSRRNSLVPPVLLRSSRQKLTGILRADHKGVALAMHKNVRFSRMLTGRRRPSTVVKQVATMAQILSFGLSEGKGAQSAEQDGAWWIKVDRGAGAGEEQYEFLSENVFAAVGWLQSLRVLRGEPQITVVALLGETGVGKSLLASKLAGLPKENAVFPVAATLRSVTESTSMYLTRWFNDADQDEVIVIDTPGLSDSQGRDDVNVADMVKKLGQLGGVHTFGVLFNSQSPRLSGPLVRMLQIFEASFGDGFWNHAVLMFTRWSTSPSAEEDREMQAPEMSEAWNHELVTRFPAIDRMARVDKKLKCFFVDSAARRPAEAERATASLGNFSVIARQHRLFDCRHELPDPGVAFEEEGGEVPAEVSELVGFLRNLFLLDKVHRLRDEGVTTSEQLLRYTDRQIREYLGWTADEVSRLRAPPVALDSPHYAVLADFQALGLPTEEVRRRQLGVRDLVQLDERLARATLALKMTDLEAYGSWRERILKGQLVSDANVWVGNVVVRNHILWPYETRRKSLEVDHLGPGVVVNVRSRGSSGGDGNSGSGDGGATGPGGDGDGEPGALRGVTAPPRGWKGHPRAFDAPAADGWATVYWVCSGYTDKYRVGADGANDLEFAVAADHGLTDFDPEHPDNMRAFVLEDPAWSRAALPPASQVRATFGYPMGKEEVYWAKFDVRPNFCRAVGGFVPGDVTRLEVRQRGEVMHFDSTCIGAGVMDSGAVSLYYKAHLDNVVGCSPYNGEGMVRTHAVEVVERAHADFGCHFDDGIKHDALDVVRKGLQETFCYQVGSQLAQPAMFDVRDEVLAEFYDLRHGEVIFLKQPRKRFTIVGVSTHDSADTPRFWMHQEDHVGATVWPELHEDLAERFERPGTIVRLTPFVRAAPAVNFNRPTDQQLRNLRLNLTYEFPFGLQRARLRRFDVSHQACVLLCGFVSGTVLSTPGDGGLELTVVGVAEKEDTGLPTIYFYPKGQAGAGVLPDYYEYLDNGTFTPAETTRNLDELREALAEQQRLQNGGMPALLALLAGLTASNEAPPDPDPQQPPPAAGAAGAPQAAQAAGGDANGQEEGPDQAFFEWLARETGRSPPQ